MGEWRHGAMHGIGVKSGPNDGRRCRCTTPAPDPASPCGFKEGGPKDIPCGAVAHHDWHDKRFWWQEPWLWHPHQPTRCTCGHPIERTDR